MLTLWKKIWNKHRDLVVYVIFGVLTTVVNFLVYYPLYNLYDVPAAAANVIAWAVAVIFAFLTNKPFVFQSHDWSFKTWLPELGKFVTSRLLSGGFETLLVYLSVDVLSLDGNICKVIISVLVVITNYVASKYLVFKK